MISIPLLLHSLSAQIAQATSKRKSHHTKKTYKDTYGVIDVGSNSVRLCIYTLTPLKNNSSHKKAKTINAFSAITSIVTSKTPSHHVSNKETLPPYPLKKIFDEKKTIGLAAYVHEGYLSEEGLAVAAKAIKHQLSHSRRLRCEKLGIFATAALRNCNNSKEALSALSSMVNYPIELASGKQEAHLGHAGIKPEFEPLNGYLIDIGGGSSEVSFLCEGAIKKSISLPIGALSLWETCVEQALPTPKEMEACSNYLKYMLATSGILYLKEQHSENCNIITTVGVGGTLRTIAKILEKKEARETFRKNDYQKNIFTASNPPKEVPAKEFSHKETHFAKNTPVISPTNFPNKATTHKILTQADLESFIQFYQKNPGEFVRSLVLVASSRIHTLIPGAIIALELLKFLNIPQITLADHGAREGYILTWIQKEEADS